VSMGLLLRSAQRLWHTNPGFNPGDVLTMTISLPNNKFDWQHNVAFEREVTAAVKSLPSVREVAVIQGVPMRGGGFLMTFSVEGMPQTVPTNLPVAHSRVISADYFRVMEIPILDGRDFDARDDVGERGHPAFILVNHTLAARYWPDQTAVGKRLRINPSEWATVAGVVGDVRYASLDALPEMEIYLPDGIYPQAAVTLLVKSTADPLRVIRGVRSRIAQVDPEAFVTDIRSMEDLISASLAARRFGTLLLTLCAAIALALALSGIYGIVAQAAAQRKLEIGVRVALGATPERVIRLMLRRTGGPVVLGTAVGLGATAAAARLWATMLFDIQPLDPPTILAAVAMFTGVALGAALIPARRASRVDPMVALRAE
jgi:putative ABC transport system permease protein